MNKIAGLFQYTPAVAIFLWSSYYFEKGGGFGGPFWNFSKIRKTPRGIHLINMTTKYEHDTSTRSWSNHRLKSWLQTDGRTDRQTEKVIT